MEEIFVDLKQTREIRQLIRDRLDQEADCPGIERRCDDYGRYYRFMVGDRVFIHVIAYDEAGGRLGTCYLTVLDGPSTPVARVTLDGDTIAFSGRPAEQYERVLARIKARFATGFIPAKLHMPYGYVEDDTVVAIWYSRSFQGDVPGAIHTGISEFALQGHDLPKPLLGRVGDSATYIKQYWKLVRAGTIIELRSRILTHPGTLWHRRSKTDWRHLVFSESDHRQPQIPAGVPYLLRLGSDPAGSDLPRTREAVAIMQKHDLPPENLSEFFASVH